MRRKATMIGFGVLVLLGAGALLYARPDQPRAPQPSPPASALPQAMAMLEPGLWTLKPIGQEGAPLNLCVHDVRQLLQPFNPPPMCRQFVVDQGPDHVSASYDCDGRGQGHTALRVETTRLVQIDSQGVADGRPFAARLEGRWTGSCPETERP